MTLDKDYYKNKLLLIPNDYQNLLGEEINKSYFLSLIDKVSDAYISHVVFPKVDDVYKAMELTKVKNIKLVIFGQDPYFNKGEAQGIAFSVPNDIKRPPSLNNIFKEICNEFEFDMPISNSLIPLCNQGVLLLNTILTVIEGNPLSMKSIGWEKLTSNLIYNLSRSKKHVVYLLLGNSAQKLEKYIESSDNYIIKTSHPSPLGAHKGFLGSNCFLNCNNYLKSNGIKEIDFHLD